MICQDLVDLNPRREYKVKHTFVAPKNLNKPFTLLICMRKSGGFQGKGILRLSVTPRNVGKQETLFTCT